MHDSSHEPFRKFIVDAQKRKQVLVKLKEGRAFQVIPGLISSDSLSSPSETLILNSSRGLWWFPGLFFFRGARGFSSSFWTFVSYFPVNMRDFESCEWHDPITRQASRAWRLPLHMLLTVVCYKLAGIHFFSASAHWSVITYKRYLQNGKIQHIVPCTFAIKWLESWEKLMSDLRCTVCFFSFFS